MSIHNKRRGVYDFIGLSEPEPKEKRFRSGDIQESGSGFNYLKPLLKAGFTLVRLKPHSKEPVSRNGSIVQVRSWAEAKQVAEAGGNLGVRLGRHSKVGGRYLAVVDLDVKDSGSQLEAMRALKDLLPEYKSLPRVVSGSGGASRHYYITTSEPVATDHCLAKGDGWKVELIGDGNYVVLPGSIHPNGRQYTWAKPFNEADIAIGDWPAVSDATLAKLGNKRLPNTEGLKEPVGLSLEQLESLVDHLPPEYYEPHHGYTSWYNAGAALHHETGGSKDGLRLFHRLSKRCPSEYAKCRHRLNGKWRTFDSSTADAVTIRSLFRDAEGNGWQRPDLDTTADLDIEDLGEDTRPIASALTFLTPEQCAQAPARGYVLKGMIAPGDVGCIFGDPGVGKSLIAPHIGYAITQGRDAFGMRTRQGKVFYVAAEDPTGMRSRITALAKQYGNEDSFVLVEGVSNLLDKTAPDLAALRKAVIEQQPTLIVIDTLAMAFPALEENNAEAMGRVVKVGRALAESGAAVIFIHHGTKAEGNTPRGHSLLNGALDFALRLTKSEDGVIRGKLTKNRNGGCDIDIAFRIATRTLGQDEDGDAIMAAFARELSADMLPRGPKLNPATAAAFDLLRDMAHSSGMRRDGMLAVKETEWRRHCDDTRKVSSSENPDSRRRAADRALSALIHADRVSAREGWLYIVDSDIGEFDDLDATENDGSSNRQHDVVDLEKIRTNGSCPTFHNRNDNKKSDKSGHEQDWLISAGLDKSGHARTKRRVRTDTDTPL